MDLGSLAFAAAGASEIGVIVLFSFLPPVVWVVWIRNTEKYGREPWGMIIGMFLWGAIFAVIIGALLSLLFLVAFEAATPVEQVLARRFSDPATILVALVIAPFTEEFAKAFGVLRRSFVIREAEDGFVYGATSGLGFSATENLLYGFLALTQFGFAASLFVIAVRSVSSSFLHASATSLTGYGIARHRLWGPRFSAIPWYLAAVAMHASFNTIASLGDYLSDPSRLGDAGVLLALAGGIVFAFVAISVVRGKIIEHDARQGWVP